jgi:hypothetical protein
VPLLDLVFWSVCWWNFSLRFVLRDVLVPLWHGVDSVSFNIVVCVSIFHCEQKW